MNRQIKVIGKSSLKEFEEKVNTEMINGWIPHWDTFKVSFADSRNDFLYILMEKKMEDII